MLDSPEKTCNIFLAENFIFKNVFTVNVNGSDVQVGICLYENIFTDSRYDVPHSTLTAKKAAKMKFSVDKILYIRIFLRRIQRLQIFKIPTDVIYTSTIIQK